MKHLRNQNGIALITALMFTVLSLVISMALLYMVTAGARTTGAMKAYRNAVAATYGGAEVLTKDILVASFRFKDYSAAHPGTSFSQYMTSSLGYMATGSTVSNCFRQHLTQPRSQWSGSCADSNLNPKIAPDMKFQLNASSGTPFTVYTKVVDTMERKFTVLDTSGTKKTVTMAGNSDASSIVLDGGSTTDGGGVTVPHYPYLYRLEVQGENQQQKANISVLYAY